MKRIAIISCSTRPGRKSHGVALAIEHKLKGSGKVSADLIDLMDENIPMFTDRIDRMENPPAILIQVAERIKQSEAIILVSPEYNGSYTAALKSLVDSLVPSSFSGKAIGICAVSGGIRGGIRAGMQMQQLMLALMANPIPQMLLVPNVAENFDQDGNILQESMKGMVDNFLANLTQ
jgi:NAD(P)H-dependent FMN reductase